jgi:hypothetical protein
MSIPDGAQVVSAAASVIALAIAAAATLAAFLQIRSNAKLSRDNTALEAHRELLKLSIDRPELSSSTLMLQHLHRRDFAGILDELSTESERTLWFLSYVLNAMEQILESNARDPWWRATMAAQVSYHEGLLREVWPTWREHYGEVLQRFMEDELN